MTRLKLFFFTGLLLKLSISIAFGQPNKIDSLKNELVNSSKDDTNKINTLNELSKLLIKKGYADSAIAYAEKAKTLAIKKSFKKGNAMALGNVAAIYEQQGNYSKANNIYHEVLKIKVEMRDKEGIANCYSNIGTIYMKQFKGAEALYNYFSALKIRQEILEQYKQDGSGSESQKYNDKQKDIAALFNSIGNVYKNQENFAEALKYYFSSLKIAEEIDSKYGIALLNNNIGIVYKEQRNYSEALKYYLAAMKIKEELGQTGDSHFSNILTNIGNVYSARNNSDEALKYYNRALTIREELGDKLSVADSYHNIGNIYSRQENYNEALNKLFVALKIREETEYTDGIVASYIDIGSVYTSMNKTSEAHEYAKKGLMLALKIRHKEWIKNAYLNLATLDSLRAISSKKSGNWEQAAKYFNDAYSDYRNHIVYRDSLLNEENTEKIVQVQMNYNFEKSDAIKKQEQWKKEAEAKIELTQKEKQRNYFIAGFAAMAFLSLITFRIYRQTQKAHNIISEQKKIVDQKQKEMLDSIHYARKIQYALITSEKYIERKLKELNKN